jgi:excisionase family DNA binding protein
VADLLLSSRNVELAARVLERVLRRDGGVPNDDMRQLAAALAIAVPLTAVRLPHLLLAIGPQATAAVKAEVRCMDILRAASKFDGESTESASSFTVTLSVSEAARIAGVSRQAIRAAAAAGRLAATKDKDRIGAWRITVPALDKWMEARAIAA